MTSAGGLGSALPGHGPALARFLSVGNWPALIISLPFSDELMSFMGKSQGGPFSSVQEYVSKEENLVDLLCHAHTSYHTLWEIRQWYSDEGFQTFNVFPFPSFSSAILPNLIFYFGRKLSSNGL